MQELIEAITSGEHDEIRSLLETGADANASITVNSGLTVDESGRLVQSEANQTPLTCAIGLRDAATVALLLEFGADPNTKAGADNAEPPLILAAIANNVEIMDLLLNAGADIEQVGASGRTALLWCARMNLVKAALYLVERGAAQTGKALAWAEALEYKALTQRLREAGIEPDPESILSEDAADLFASPRKFARTE